MSELFSSPSLAALRALGLHPSLLPALQALDWRDEAQLWRLTEIRRERLGLQSAQGRCSARALPALLQALQAQDQTLAVGDWLLARRNALGEYWVHERVPPLNTLSRRDPEGRRQALVSNVDLALLVMGLDHDFKLARLDRYLVLTRAAGVPAVVVLSKADHCDDPARQVAQVRAHLAHAREAVLDVVAVDGTSASALGLLQAWLGPGQTLVLLGSSGAGKSTLSNTLCEAALQDTGGVRLDDSRGRHTTTTRTLQRTAGGACIIDTPGLRGLQLDASTAELALAFDDVSSLAEACRYRNCGHQGEPGCAVREVLSPARLKSFQKLQREAERGQLSHQDRRERLANWKARGREAAAALRVKRGDGG